MRTVRMSWGLLLLGMVVTSSVSAEDTSDLKSEIARLQTTIAALESAQGSAAGGDAKSLTSMKKNSQIIIGGGMEIATRVVRRDDVQNAANRSDNDNVNYTLFDVPSGYLKFKIQASPDAYGIIKLDLDDTLDSRTNQDDFLEEIYFGWKHVNGSNWGLRFGKMEIAFGQDKDILITDGYHHGSKASYLGKAFESNTAPDGTGTGNPHGAVGDFNAPREIDNTFALEATYAWKDFAKLQFSVFQNNRPTGGVGRLTRGMHEDRSTDSLLFESFSSRLILTPVEGLTIKLSGVNLHDSRAGDRDINGRGASSDQQAVSLGFDWKLNNLPLEVFGEYSHGFGWNYNDYYDTNTSQLGTIWSVTKAVDLILIGEWMDINDDRVAAMQQDEDYYKLAVAGFYHFPNGIRLSLEYIHEWYDRDSSMAGDDRSSQSDAIVFGTKWSF